MSPAAFSSAPAATDPERAAALALGALGWVLADAARADRLLAVTGLSPDGLRARLGDPAMLAAILAFLDGHEPDLLACAAALGVAPDAIVMARGALDRG